MAPHRIKVRLSRFYAHFTHFSLLDGIILLSLIISTRCFHNEFYKHDKQKALRWWAFKILFYITMSYYNPEQERISKQNLNIETSFHNFHEVSLYFLSVCWFPLTTSMKLYWTLKECDNCITIHTSLCFTVF